MRKILFLMFSMLLFAGQLLAQNRIITGTVTDDKGIPLANVSVQIKGTALGTLTKENGTYSLSVPSNARTLVFSSVNMEPKELSIGNLTVVNSTLVSTEKAMEEVVVTGYQTVRKRDVAAAISKITAEEIDNLPMPNFAQAMQGRAAGVIVAAANGIPGGSLSVIIRGVGSINAGTTPLYVVDGIQINTGSNGAASTTGSINTQNNPLNFLNPDDIESIEVLKDAAAASIYGAKAANGVVLVTTKKGKAGAPKFTINAYAGRSSTLGKLDVLNTQEWYQVRTEALRNAANPFPTATSIDSTVASNLGITPGIGLSKTRLDSLPSYDWQDAAFSNGTIKNIEASVQGGNQNINYYLSASYSDISAFIKPTNFKRGALLSKVSYKVSKKVTIDNSLSLSTVGQNAPYSTGSTGFGNPAYAAPQILPINPIYNADGTYYGLPGSGQNITGSLGHNIIAIGNYVTYFTRTNQLVGNASITYNPNANLTFKSLVGLDYRTFLDQRYQDPRVNDAYAVSGRLSDQADYNTNFITTTTGNFRKTFGDVHYVNALAGIEYRRDQNQWFEADGQGFPSYQLQYLNAASTAVSVGGAWSANANFSQFAKLGYTYNNKYVFNYTVRRDGSSRFGTNNLYGIFQSAQVAWNAKESYFLRNSRVVSDLKLRYSFGQAGNDQIPNTQFRQLYGATRIYGGGSAINPTQLGNPDLSWELREENNVGIDASFLNSRISLTVDVYRKINKNLLLSRSLYSTTGFSSILQNLGSMQNDGLEILLQATPLKGEFKWNTSFNIALQKNKIKSLYDTLKALPADASIRIGESYGSILAAKWAGVNPATGRGMWYDINGEITYNPTNADRIFLGNIYPKAFGGWNNEFSYKNFSVVAFFQYEYGRIRYDGQYVQMMRMGGTTANVVKSGYDDRWTTPGQITDVPRAFNGMADFNSVSWATGTRYYLKTDYVRLKQVTLAYDLKNTITKRLHIDGAKFYIQGINLWTYTKWNSYDPEYTGDNYGIIPQSKNMTVGLQVRL